MRMRDLSLAGIFAVALTGSALADDRCTRVHDVDFNRQIVEKVVFSEDAIIPQTTTAFPFTNPSFEYQVLAKHDLDLDGDGTLERLVVTGFHRGWFTSTPLPQRLHRVRRVDDLVPIWSQDLPDGLSGLGSTGDFDGDGRTDLTFERAFPGWIASPVPGGFQLFWAAGDRPLVPGQQSNSAARLVGFDDVDGDGLRDVVLRQRRSWNDDFWTVAPGLTGRTFDEGLHYTTIAERVRIDEPDMWTSVIDFNNDGLDDLLAITQFEFTQSIAVSRGDGTFDIQPVPREQYFPSGVSISDLDGDGTVDMLYSNYVSLYERNIKIRYGVGGGDFGAPIRVDGSSNYGRTTADLDGDGDRDIVTFTAESHGIGSIRAYLFEDRLIETIVEIDEWANPLRVVVDLEQDGKEEILLTYRVLRLIDGELSVESIAGIENLRPIAITPTDFDNDGLTDLILAVERTWGDNYMVSYRGLGDGRFEQTWIGRSLEPREIDQVEDVNGDGRPDLITYVNRYPQYDANRQQKTSVRLGDGLGRFAETSDTAWLSFSGKTGRFRESGTRDMVRVGWFGYFGREFGFPGHFSIELNPNRGFVQDEDLAPPVVEFELLDGPEIYRIAILPIDDCIDDPRVTDSWVELAPIGDAFVITYVPDEVESVSIIRDDTMDRWAVVLRGADRSASVTRFLQARERGGFRFEHMKPVALAAGSDSPPLPDFPTARVVQAFEFDGEILVRAEAFGEGSDLTLAAIAADRVSEGTSRASFVEMSPAVVDHPTLEIPTPQNEPVMVTPLLIQKQ